jgi:hypothetical protein
MIRFRKRGLALMGTAVLLAATVGFIPAPASAAPRALAAQGTPFGTAQFAAYGTGSELSANVVPSGGGTAVARVDQAFSANTASSGTLGAALNSPVTGQLVQTDQTANAANAYGRGSGAEVGLGVSPAIANQIQLGIAEAHAPPPTGLITKTALPVNIPGLVNLQTLTGKAAASYNSTFCPIGAPLAYGEGDASGQTGVVGATPPVVSGTGATGTQAAQTTTRTDLIANPDGTFGISNTVSEIIAPLSVNLGTLSVQITVQGNSITAPLAITTHNNGEGTAGVSFVNTDPVVKVDILVGGVNVYSLTAIKASGLNAALAPLLGTGGAINLITAPLNTVLTLDFPTNPPAMTPVPGAPAGATSIEYDLLHLKATVLGVQVADVRLGHVESEVLLPNGPIECTVPVAKVANPATVVAGNTFTWVISVPSSATALSDANCDLTNIKVTDMISVKSGGVLFTVGTISNGGVYAPTSASTGTVTWANLGTYHPGDPPIQLSVAVSVGANSPAGVLQDTANVSATLGNCTGGASGVASATLTSLNGASAVIGGSITLAAPSVSAAAGGAGLATTGTGPMLPWIAAGLLILAEGTRRLLRRARSHA